MAVSWGRFIAALAFAAATGAVQAQGYVGVDGGFSWVRDVDFDLPTTPNPVHPTEFDSGSVIAVRGGWRFGSFRAELEGAWRRNDAETFGGQGDVGPARGEIKADSWMVNALYDWRFGSKLVPYVGLGLGTVKVSASNIQKDLAPNDCCTGIVDGSDRAFGWQAIVGAAYEFTPNWAATLDYRYLATNDVKLDYRAGCLPDGSLCLRLPGTTEEKYQSHTLSLGVRYQF